MVNCLYCGSLILKKRHTYCNRVCYHSVPKSEATRKKMSENNVGFSGRNHSVLSKNKMSKVHAGSNHHMFNKKHSTRTKNKISASVKRVMTDDLKNKISKNTKAAMTDDIKLLLSKKMSARMTPEYRKKIGQRMQQYMKKHKGKYRDTKPERQMRDILNSLNVEFIQQHFVSDIQHSYLSDFFIPSKKIVIEVDGLYWHNFPNGREIDKVRTAELISAGYKIYRFWERMFTIEDVRQKLSGGD